MCVETGKQIIRRSYTRLPMPDSMIRKVERMAKKTELKMGHILETDKKKHLNGRMKNTIRIMMKQNKSYPHC